MRFAWIPVTGVLKIGDGPVVDTLLEGSGLEVERADVGARGTAVRGR